MSKAADRKFKTKFPVTRIKRIMQMDEDVGKVAQATPILISKALELFMHALITETCNETRTRNSKRMTVGHLKRCIEHTDQFDFLKDLVEKIADPTSNEETQTKTASSSSTSQPIIRRSDMMSLKNIIEPTEPEDAEVKDEEKKVPKKRVRKRKNVVAED